MRKLILPFATFCFLTVFLQAAPISYTAAFSKQKPLLDGRVDEDPAWQSVAWSNSDFFLHRQQKPPQLATRFKALYTDDALYLAVVCDETEIDKLKPVYNFGEFWNYDSIEAFFQPKSNELIQLISNYQGMKLDVIDETVSKRTDFKTGWSCAARLDNDRWLLEFCIPFYLLGVAPVERSVSMPFNLCRNSIVSNERSTWSFQSGAFKNVKDFGRLLLAKAPSSEAGTLAAALQRPHWDSLLERWMDIRKDPAWKDVFDQYPSEYAELEEKTTDAVSSPPLSERIHQLLSIMENAAKKQDELHHKRIMKRLFDE